MKTKLKFILIIAVAFLTAYCSDNGNDPVEPDPDAVRVAGKYEAVEFIIIGDNDAGVDVLETGGFINIELFLNFKVGGMWSVPVSQNYRNGFDTTDFSGIYEVNGDSLKLKDLNNLVGLKEYLIKKDTLEMKLLEGFGPTIIVLSKMN